MTAATTPDVPDTVSSTEVRWFAEGDPPHDMRQWCDSLGESEPHPARIDWYVLLPSYQSVGIKVREDRLEIKKHEATRPAPPRLSLLCHTVENWRKWSFPLAGDAARDTLGDYPFDWIGVKKERALWRLRLPSEAQVPDATGAVAGCHAELAVIAAGAMTWWSFGIEAYGPASLTPEIFEDVVENLPHPPAALRDTICCCYPAWLAECIAPCQQELPLPK